MFLFARYHNKILDTTNLIRFTNIANNAMLELTPAKKSRQDSPVGVWLQVEDGSRLSGEFPSSRKSSDVIIYL
jgi:tether containing UBX domain for GLUT4